MVTPAPGRTLADVVGELGAALRPGSGPVYLASPYTHPDPFAMVQRAHAAARAAGALMWLGIPVYSPIAHGHAIARTTSLPAGWSFWRDQCRPLLEACGVLAVLTIDGHAESVGVGEEIAWAVEARKPVVYLPPELADP